MSYTDLTIKTIYGRSYNECNHPECGQIIIAVDPNTEQVVNHGEMAHIRARKEGEERWDADFPKERLNEADNLILLCANHHKIIDQKGAAKHYSVDLLNDWKATHYASKEVVHDRGWVYGSSRVCFWVEGEQHVIEFWRDKQGNVRFFTPEQLEQAKAAQEIQYCFAQLGGLFTSLDQADATPANPSHQTQNDSMMRILKSAAEDIRRSRFSSPGTEYQSMLERLYINLRKCPDITLSELAGVGAIDNLPSNTMIVGGEVTQERLMEAMNAAPDNGKERDR